MSTLLEVNNLTKKYGTQLAVNDVSLTIKKGDIYGLIGKNGAGKTTLFKIIMGLVEPTSGDYHLYEETNLNLARRRTGFMIGANFIPYFNAFDNLVYFARLKGVVDEAEIKRILDLVELGGVKKKFRNYSMGMKQRLSIANALLGSPELVFLDEPVNGLDPQGIADFRKLILRLNREEDITFMISSHILQELSLMATRFGFMHEGHLLKEVTGEEILELTKRGLVLRVDNTEKATVLLEQELKTVNYAIGSMKEIILKDYLDAPEKVAELFVSNGLKLYELSKKEISLEEFFFDLIGGIKNV